MENKNKMVYAAICAVQGELAKIGISKEHINPQGSGYKFRGIDDVYNALAPLLSKNKLCILPRVLSRSVVERVSKSGGNLFYVVLDVEFDFISAEDGSMHTARGIGEAMDSGDKGTNKAMSAAYKYVCFQAFCIPTEGDNDPDATTHEIAPAKPAHAMAAMAPKPSAALPGCVSDAQAKRFFAIYRFAGKTDEEAKTYLKKSFGIDKSNEIKKDDYEAACLWAKGDAQE